MSRYIIRRLLILPIVLFGLSILIFGILQFLDPAERASLYVSDIPKQKGALDAIIQKYGLNDPLYMQYARWVGQIIHGDLGWSRSSNEPVVDSLKKFFPATAELALWSFIPIIVIGVWLGVLAATHQDKLVDQAARVFSIIGYSFPSFVFGLLVLMVFYATLQWFPPGRLSDWANQVVYSANYTSYTGMNTVDSLLNGRADIFFDALRHMFLPALTLSYIEWALILRVTRSSMLDVIRQDYVNVARAKGLSERTVINKHARPNAMIPVATMGGLLLVQLMNGVIITETVFNYRGMGFWVANAALRLDVITVLDVALFEAALLIFANLIVDIMYAYLDPRIRLA